MNDKLEQVLKELEALEKAAKEAAGEDYAPGEYYDAALREHQPFLLAKLRAAVEMEKALERAERTLVDFDACASPEECDDQPDHWHDLGAVRVALAAWRKAGEEKP